MKEFEYYLKEGTVKKQKPDTNTAQAVFKDATERIEHAKNINNKTKAKQIQQETAEFINKTKIQIEK